MKIKYTVNELNNAAREILNHSPSKKIAFYAPMGAGKTTLIKALVKILGAIDAGSSPTFSIVNEYHNTNAELLAYHFDFYRLNDEMEALDLGLEDYFNRDVWTFMEWPEKIASFLPDETTVLKIEIIDEHTRVLSLDSQ